MLQAVQRDLQGVKSVLGEPQEVTVATIPGAENLVDWMNCFRVTQVTASLPCCHATARPPPPYQMPLVICKVPEGHIDVEGFISRSGWGDSRASLHLIMHSRHTALCGCMFPEMMAVCAVEGPGGVGGPGRVGDRGQAGPRPWHKAAL